MWRPLSHNSQKSIGVEVYELQHREIKSGDLIRWTRSDKLLGLLSPELAKIELIDSDRCQCQPIKVTSRGIVPEGEPIIIHHQEKRYQHWDHAYAMTGYSAQGKTIPYVILNAESYRKNLVSQPSFIVGLTRAAQNITIYTDNKEALLSGILNNSGEKSSALEIIGELKKANQHQVTSSTYQPRTDINRIKQMLQENAEHIVKQLLGDPKEQHSNQYRYGSKKGSLIVTLQGDKRGLWHDFQTGEGGNLLHLIAKQFQLDMKTDFKKILTQAISY